MDDTNRSTDVPANGSTRSLAFDGVNEEVTLATQVDLEYADAWSVSLWYRGSDPGANFWGEVLLGRNHNDIHSNLTIHNGKFTWTHYNGGWFFLESASLINDNEWHHLTMVHYADQTADLYVDGVREVTAGNAASSGGLLYSYRVDGFMNGFADSFTEGKLDDVRIYNHALTEAEVDALAAVPEPASLALLAGGVLLLARRPAR